MASSSGPEAGPDAVTARALLRQALGPEAWRARGDRLVDRAWIITQSAVGAALAWWLAHVLLGHQAPFFAPVTAMVCLGLTYGHRIRRVIELTVGVALGIAVGDLWVQVFGPGVWQIAAVAAAAMAVAVVVGAGQMLMLQAGIQGVMVATLLAGEGQAVSRWLEALVGGGVALAITLIVPTWRTVRQPRRQAAELTRSLAELLEATADGLAAGDQDRLEGVLESARRTQRSMDALREAVSEALAATRSAGMRREHREGVQLVLELLDPLDHALRNTRVLVRRAQAALLDEEQVPPRYLTLVRSLAEATTLIAVQLAGTGPLSPAARQELVSVARRSTYADPRAGLSTEVIRAQVRSIVVDLLMLAGVPEEQARTRIPPTREP